VAVVLTLYIQKIKEKTYMNGSRVQNIFQILKIVPVRVYYICNETYRDNNDTCSEV
jgi:hypothetical protein